jgi:hypothetical protein
MLSDAKAIVNNQLSSRNSLPRCPTSEDSSIIPDKFDFREKFPKCVHPVSS